MRFSLKQLQYFIAAGDAGSIRSASRQVGVSEPSISTAIAHLEREFNVQLFVRHHARGLSLTPAGRQLLGETRDVIERAGALYTAADDLAESMSGRISVGSLVSLAAMIMPTLTHAFTAAHPHVSVVTSEDNQENLIDALRRAKIDVALTYDMQLPEDITFEPLATLPAHVIVGEDHRFAGRSEVALSELADDPYFLLNLPSSREYYLSLFMRAGITPTIAGRSRIQDVVWAMVANGTGYSLRNVRPKTDYALDGRRIIRISLSGDYHPLSLGIATPARLRKRRLVEAFEMHCRSRISDAEIPGMMPLPSV